MKQILDKIKSKTHIIERIEIETYFLKFILKKKYKEKTS